MDVTPNISMVLYAVLWHSSLSFKNRKRLETATKIILGRRYVNYKNALKTLNLDNLDERRKIICLKFAKNRLKKKSSCHDFLVSKQKYFLNEELLFCSNLIPHS